MKRIAEQAARWARALDTATDAEREDFVDWVRQAPEHLEEFLIALTLHEELGRADWDRMPAVNEALRRAAANVVSFPGSDSPCTPSDDSVPRDEPRPRTKAARTLIPAAAAAAALAVLTLAGWWLGSNVRRDTYATEIGEQRNVELADGSRVSLNSRSEVAVHFTDQARDLVLDGEATFTVEHDAARPFRVRSGNAVIQAIGTQFNVHRLPSGTTVTVVEGSVRVSSELADMRVPAGQEVRVDLRGRIARQRSAEVSGGAAWRDQRLVFRDNTLEDIVAEFNRWNRRQIRIEPGVTAGRLYDGAFDAHDPESLLAFLGRQPELAIDTRKSELLIRKRTEH